MTHKNKSKVTNEAKIDLESIQVQTISSSNNYLDNEQLKMFVITFMVGKTKVSQTRHMTDSHMNEYKKLPSIEKVTNASKGKGLQDTHYNILKGGF